MKKHLTAVILLTFSLLFFSCEDTSKKIIGTWVFEVTRADIIKDMVANDDELTEAAADAVIEFYFKDVTFPAAVYRMVFTETTFEAVTIDFLYGIELPAGSGNYSVDGNKIILTGGTEVMTGTVRGKKLTFKAAGEALVLTKK